MVENYTYSPTNLYRLAWPSIVQICTIRHMDHKNKNKYTVLQQFGDLCLIGSPELGLG